LLLGARGLAEVEGDAEERGWERVPARPGAGGQAGRPWGFPSAQKLIFGVARGEREVKSYHFKINMEACGFNFS